MSRILKKILVILLLSIFIFANSIINGHFGIFKIIIDNRFILIILGILFLFITIYLYFRNNKLKKYTPIMVIASILIILIPITYSKIISNITTGNVEYKDYSKSKYIKVGSAKIPSLYSIIGERKIEMSGYIKNNYDEGLKQTYDVAYIYVNLTIEDINKYKEALIDYGYKNISVCIKDSDLDNECKECEFLIMNENDYYIVVSI